MSEIFISLLFLVFGAAIGAFISSRFNSLKNKSETSKLEADILNTDEQKNRLQTQINESLNNLESMRNEKDSFKDELTRKTTEFNTLEKKLIDQEEKLRIQFENLANRILDEKSEKFTKQNKVNLDLLLNPLQKKIETFEKKVGDSQTDTIKMHSALKQQLEGLKDLNQKMSKETSNLTKALKGDSKMQGNWGELVLERVLEKSGLEKDREYFVQQSFILEDGSRVLPDVVLHLPDNKKMIIDSKVSITDYNRYVNSDNDIDKEAFLKAHINSINKHVDQLSEKNYQDLYEIESPDFVLMFIPIEPAFAVALNNDNLLYNKAFEKNIVIVTPSTLLATLRTIDSMWNNEKQQQNALEIAKQAGRLFDQFVNLTDDLIKVGNQLKTVQGSYDVTMKKLTGKGNLITKVENIKKLGIKQKKHFNDKLLERSNEED